MTHIPVLDRFARGYPDHVGCPNCGRCDPSRPPLGEQDAVTYGPLTEALTTAWQWDAHFAAYQLQRASEPEVTYARRPTHRALGEYHARMVVFVVDVEPEGHAPRTPEWDAQEAPKILKAISHGAYYYETRGGYRLLWTLAEPYIIASEHDAARWSASYLAALEHVKQTYGIEGDKACKDWTRLYRLPHVVRDGVFTECEYVPPTDPQPWALTVVDVPAPRALTAVQDIDEGEPASEELLEHVRARLRMHGPAIAGQNGDQHTFKACAMVVRGYALNEHDAVTVLSEWDASNVPPWGDELRTKMDNAYNYGQGQIGEARAEWESTKRMREWGVKHGAKPRAEHEQQKPEPQAKGVLAFLAELAPDWTTILAGNIAVAFAAVENPYKALLAQARAEIEQYNGESTTPQGEERPFFESAEAMFGGTDTPPSWLIKSLLLEGGIAAIGAEPKASKTWLGTELALALATGTAALGKYDVAKATNVAYFYTEDMRDAIRSRVRSLLAGRGLTPSSIARTFHAQPRGHKIDVTRAEDCARIIASVRTIEQRAGKVGVLVLDPLRNIHVRDEDKSGDMVIVFEHLKMIGTLLACTIIIVHHSKKANANSAKRGGQRLRGSSAIHGFLDSALNLTDTAISEDSSTFTNTVESETKSGRSAGTFELTLKIEDDPRTRTAVKATWEIGSKGATNATETKTTEWEELALDAVDAMFQADVRGKPLTTTKAIRDALKCNKNTLTIALQSVGIKRGWVRQDYSTKAYALTEPGREISRARHRTAAPTPPPTEPSSVYGIARPPNA